MARAITNLTKGLKGRECLREGLPWPFLAGQRQGRDKILCAEALRYLPEAPVDFARVNGSTGVLGPKALLAVQVEEQAILRTSRQTCALTVESTPDGQFPRHKIVISLVTMLEKQGAVPEGLGGFDFIF